MSGFGANGPVRLPLWRALVDHIVEHHSYGASISDLEIDQVTQGRFATRENDGFVDRDFRRFMSRVRRKLLRESGFVIVAVDNDGYRLIKPEEYGAHARQRVRQAARELRLSVEVLEEAPQALLSDEQNLRNADSLAKFGRTEMALRAALRATRPSLPPSKLETPKMLSSPTDGGDEEPEA